MTNRLIGDEVVRQLERLARGERTRVPASMMTIDHAYAEARRPPRAVGASVSDVVQGGQDAPGLNEEIDVKFIASALPARVIWTNGSECGVAFDQNMDGYALMARMAAGLRADEPSRSRSAQRRLANPDPDGSFRPGLRVKMVQADGRERAAVVSWARDNFAGLALED